jgi:hypothetical protein
MIRNIKMPAKKAFLDSRHVGDIAVCDPEMEAYDPPRREPRAFAATANAASGVADEIIYDLEITSMIQVLPDGMEYVVDQPVMEK